MAIYIKDIYIPSANRSGCNYSINSVIIGSTSPGSTGGDGATADLSGLVTNASFTGYTAATTACLQTKLNVSTFATFTGTTLPSLYYTKACADARFVHLSGNETVCGVKTFCDCLKTDSIESSTISFSQGTLGGGYKIWQDEGDKYNLEIDCINVRNALSAAEFRINKLKFSSDLVVSAGGVKAVSGLSYNSTLDKFYFLVNEEDRYTIQAGDIIHSQQFNGSGIHNLYLTAWSGDSSYCRVYVCENYNGVCCRTPTPSNYNLNYFEYVVGPYFYSMSASAAGQYARTSLFSMNTGQLRYLQCFMSSYDTFGVWLYCCDSTPVCNIINQNGSCSQCIDRTVNVNTGCYCMRYIACSNSSANIYGPVIHNCYTTTVPDVSGFEFVQQGNTGETERQDLIEISANQANAPYIRLLTGVSGCTVNGNNVKTCIDKDGLYADGAFLENAEITGTVCANCGEIGGWAISENAISNDYVTLDSLTNTISVKDAGGVERVNVSNGPLTPLAGMIAGSTVCISEACAAGADLRIDRCAGTTTCTLFYQEVTAGVATSLTDYTGYQSGKNFPTCSLGNPYTVSFGRYISTAYSLCPNTCCDQGSTYICKKYSLAGTYEYKGTTCLCDGNLRLINNWTTGARTPYPAFACCRRGIDDLGYAIFNSTGSSFFLKSTFCLVDNVSQTECTEIWNKDPYQLIYSYSTSCPLLLCTNSELKGLCYYSEVCKTELRNNGMQIVLGCDNYYRFADTACIRSDTTFTCSDVYLCCNSALHLHNSNLTVAECKASSYAAWLINSYPNCNSYGLYVQAGHCLDSCCHNYFLRAYRNSAVPVEVGGLYNSCASTFAVYTCSDCRAKTNIKDAPGALSVINKIPVREFEWCDDKEHKKNIGYIAQEVEDIEVPGLSFENPDGKYFTAPTLLIPYLHKAVQELSSCIETLKAASIK